MDKTTLNPLILGLTAVAIMAAGLLFWNNRTLSDDLATMKAARASVEREAKAATERANVAERSIEEVKAEMSKVQAANDAVNHSVTQLRNQLEQVQIQANTARGDLENRLKASGDELGKAQGDLQRANDELAKERAAREAAQKSLTETTNRLEAEIKQAQDDAAKQRAAREEAERLTRDNGASAGSGASSGAPAPQGTP